jgi:hypothetical protein
VPNCKKNIKKKSRELLLIEGKLEGRIEMTRRRGRISKQLLDDLKENKILEIERGNTRSHPVENSLWKRLRTCRKTDCRMNENSY